MRRALVLLVIAAACSKGQDTAKKGRGGQKLEYPVELLKLEAKQVEYTVDAPGSLDAFQVVQITARVQGAVDKVAFVEGQEVKEGDVLASIESERYSIALSGARATLQKAQTTQRAAQAALDRRLNAEQQSPGIVPGEEIEQKRASVDTAKADVAAAQEAVHVAELNLRDSQVRAPIKGIVQTRTVQQGQFLQPGYVLATLIQRDPLLLRFQVSQLDAVRLKPGMTANVTLRESKYHFTAKITLVSEAADPTTRLTPVTAQVDDSAHQLFLRAGAFCLVSVPVGDARKAIVVPSLAVAPTEKGNVIYVVDDKMIAHERIVEIGMHTPDGKVELRTPQAKEGEKPPEPVKEGDMMVVSGIEPLTEGAPVKLAPKEGEEGSNAAAGHKRSKGSGDAKGSDSK